MQIQRPPQQTRCQSTVGHRNAGLPSHRDTARGNGTISLPPSQISQLPSKTPIPSPPRQTSPPIDANHPLPASPESPHSCQKRRCLRTPRIRTVPRLGAHYIGTYDVALPLLTSRLSLSGVGYGTSVDRGIVPDLSRSQTRFNSETSHH